MWITFLVICHSQFVTTSLTVSNPRANILIMTQSRQTIDKNKLMTAKEVATILGKSPRTIQRMVLAGEFPNTIRAGDYEQAPLLIPGSCVIAYLERNK